MAAPPARGLVDRLLAPTPLFLLGGLLRLGLLLYGSWQDAHSAVKYTDIDYLVFTDAARFVADGQSPYARDTYRYTPLLAWLLLPTVALPLFGKLLFALADLLAGALILAALRRRRLGPRPAAALAALWLWNPMVAIISTRGSSEALLAVLTMALLAAVETGRLNLAGLLLGLAVHFKIYPFIYGPAIVWWLDSNRLGKPPPPTSSSSPTRVPMAFFSPERCRLVAISLATFMALNLLMYSLYGFDFLSHTYFHHVTRIDHRHNFSPYNTLLYLTSALPRTSSLRPESFAFVPQLLLSCFFIPLLLAKKDLATSMMAQTFAFVTFNKVCTSQYFLWYLIFLPLYLPNSSLLRKPSLGLTALLLWALAQAAWLRFGYQLEFLGMSTFFPHLWLSSLLFFLVNCWILGIIIDDGGRLGHQSAVKLHIE